VPDHDRLLADAFDDDRGVDLYQPLADDEAFDEHRGPVRQFVAELPHQLLAHDLGHG